MSIRVFFLQMFFFSAFVLFLADGVWFHVVPGLFSVHVYNPSIAFDCCYVQDYNWGAVL